MTTHRPSRHGAHWFSALTLSLALSACQSPAATGPATPQAAEPAPATPTTAGPAEAPGTAPIVPPTAPAAAAYVVTGSAATLAGPLAGAQIAVYPAASVGVGEPLGTATAGADGGFSVALGAMAADAPLVVIASLGETSLASVAVLTPDAAARRVLAARADVRLSTGTTLLYAALADRLIGLAKMAPTAAEVRRAVAAFQAAVPTAESSVKALKAETIQTLLKALGPKGAGRLGPADAAASVPKDSEIASALTNSANGLSMVIQDRVSAGATLPDGLTRDGFSFGNAFGLSVVRSSGGGSSSSAPAAAETTVYVVTGTKISANHSDGSVWVFNGDNATLTHKSATNTEVAAPFSAGITVNSIHAVDDGGVWALGDSSAKHFASDGAVIATVDLNGYPYYGGSSSGRAVDPATGTLWVVPGEGNGLYKIGADSNASPQGVDYAQSYGGSTLQLNPVDGGVWAVRSVSNPMMPGMNTLSARRLTKTGDLGGSFSSAPGAYASVPTLTVDGSDGSLWLSGSGQNSVQYSAAGTALTTKSGVTFADQATVKTLTPIIDSGDGTTWFTTTSGLVARFGTAVTQTTVTLEGTGNQLAFLTPNTADHTAWALDKPARLLNLNPAAANAVLSSRTLTLPSSTDVVSLVVAKGKVWALTRSNPN